MTDGYLSRYLDEHVWYEAWMMVNCCDLVFQLSQRDDAAAVIVRNACIDSYAVHLRNLVDFFYSGDRAKSDDVLATHYFADSRLPKSIRKQSPALKRDEAKAHKQVSHLTRGRLWGDNAQKLRPSWAVVDETLALVECLNTSGVQSRVNAQCAERIRQLRSHAKNSRTGRVSVSTGHTTSTSATVSVGRFSG